MSIVILISGRGSNMRALLEAGLPVAAVIADRADAPGLHYAREHGVATALIEYRNDAYATRAAYDAALAAAIDRYAPKAVVLAGFMRLLTPGFVERYADRLLNIHPSLLPAFPGLRTHARALAAGVKVHGCTAHFVTAALDSGPIVIQAAVPVHASDDEHSLAARVLQVEHRIYPQAVRWYLEGRLEVAGGTVKVAGEAQQWVFAA
jgi:phosphoribosylglycinamide formyltransferase-1